MYSKIFKNMNTCLAIGVARKVVNKWLTELTKANLNSVLVVEYRKYIKSETGVISSGFFHQSKNEQLCFVTVVVVILS